MRPQGSVSASTVRATPPPIAPSPAPPPLPPPMPVVAQAAPGSPAVVAADGEAAADAESSRRTGHLVIVGVLLFLAFILPEIQDVKGNDEFVFPNLRGLSVGEMSLWTRIELLYPLIAGAALIVLGAAWEHRGRGARLLCLAAFPFILDAALPGPHGAIRSVASLLVSGAGGLPLCPPGAILSVRWGSCTGLALPQRGFSLRPCFSPGAGCLSGSSRQAFRPAALRWRPPR